MLSTSILAAMDRIKADVAQFLQASAVEDICREIGYTWRNRALGPVVTIHAFLLQVLHGNTACDHVPRLVGGRFTGEAYTQAWMRLPLELFDRLLKLVCQALGRCHDQAARWLGHRVWLLDGSGCSMPDTPELQQAFGQPGNQRKGCGFPVVHVLTLFHASTGMLQKILLAPLRTHDLAQAWMTHNELQREEVLLGDRGFCSYAHLARLMQAGLHGVFRLHQKMLVDFRIGRMHAPPRPFPKLKRATGLPRSRWVKWLGHCDQLVEYFKPAEVPNWMTPEAYAALPSSIIVREVRYSVTRRGFRTRKITLVTTLLDPVRYPAEELAKLYFERWRIEVYLRHLKQTLHMDVLRCKTVAGVHKEVRMLALVYNLVRLVMLQAARQQHVNVERISFVDALRWLVHVRPGEPLRRLIVHPPRHGRVEPRVRKRRPKPYPLMTRPRHELKQALLRQ